MIDGKLTILIPTDSYVMPTGQRAHYSPSAYARAIAAAGAAPILGGEQCAKELSHLCDGLLLAGGPDIEPDLFGEEIYNDTVKVDTPRTKFEYALLKEFLAQGKAVMGICRGEQLLNVYLGGDMYQDLAHQKGLFHSSYELRHKVKAVPGSFVEKLLGEEFLVNSTHHQAVRRLAPGLKLAAEAPDGVVEAYEHESLPLFGVQWHPERLTNVMRDERTPDMAPLFTYFLDLIRAHCGN